jgi:hypothetical protein
MSTYFNIIQARQVNPTNYDRVMRFWQEVVADYCRYEKKCVVSLRELKEKFRRGHLLPSPLQTAIEELHRCVVSSILIFRRVGQTLKTAMSS